MAVRSFLRWVSLSRLLGWMNFIKVSPVTYPAPVKAIAYYVDRLLQLFPANPRGNCLPRSLVLYGFARWHGFPVQFHCGIRRLDGVLVGHAWLTLNSQPFLERSKEWEKFAVTFTFPETSEVNLSTAKMVDEQIIPAPSSTLSR